LTPPALVNSTPFLFVAAGDVQGDGIPDLAGAVSGSDVLLFAGTGGGSFGPPLTVAAGKFPRSIAIGDVNSDGLADLTVVRWDGASSACSIARASAPGVFQPPLDIALLPQAEAVALGDLDSDGDPDLAAVCAAPSNLVVLRNDLTETPSTQLFGAGTSGSRGRLGLRAPSAPAVNHPGFGVAGTNAPAAALGLALVANAADVNGSDPFAIGAALHVNLLTATEVLAFDVRSDAAGCAYLPAPIPNSPVLSGAVYHAQFLFFEGFGEKTTPSPFGLVSSKGLTIAIP
jgi:hypothetical protein